MSKIKKFFKNPRLFISDAINNKFATSDVEMKGKSGSLKKISIQKTPQGYLGELIDFVEAFDVNTLKIDDEYIWPYIRHHLWTQLYQLGFGKRTFEIIPHRLQLGTNINVPFYLRGRFKEKLGALEIVDLAENKSRTDFLFLTVVNASEQVELSTGEIYYRIIDPVFEVASKIGSVKKIEFVKVNSPALAKIKKYKYKPTLILPPHIWQSGYSEAVHFHHSFFEIMRKKIPSVNISLDNIKKLIDWEMHTRSYYLQVLSKLKPKILFLSGFHYHAPVISAANALGIKTVDLQHGIQVGWNPLYNYWEELPNSGYQALPDFFFVWGEKEFKSIEKVFNVPHRHKPVVYGNPWLEKQVHCMEKLDKRLLEKFKMFKIKFLIILQNQMEVPSLYREIIDRSPSDYLWIIRHHPKGNKFRREDFSIDKKENIFISQHIDTISLASLFEITDIVISEGSTVAVEADYYGVKNIICSDDGKKNYADEIEKGQFFYIDSYGDFINCLDLIDLDDRTARTNAYCKVDLSRILSEIVS